MICRRSHMFSLSDGGGHINGVDVRLAHKNDFECDSKLSSCLRALEK